VYRTVEYLSEGVFILERLIHSGQLLEWFLTVAIMAALVDTKVSFTHCVVALS